MRRIDYSAYKNSIFVSILQPRRDKGGSKHADEVIYFIIRVLITMDDLRRADAFNILISPLPDYR